MWTRRAFALLAIFYAVMTFVGCLRLGLRPSLARQLELATWSVLFAIYWVGSAVLSRLGDIDQCQRTLSS